MDRILANARCCDDTRALFETGKSRRFESIAKKATRELAMLDAAVSIDFLRSPSGKWLEALKGDCAVCRFEEVRQLSTRRSAS